MDLYFILLINLLIILILYRNVLKKMLNKEKNRDVKLMEKEEWSLLATHNFIVFTKLMNARNNLQIKDILTCEGVPLDPRLFEDDKIRQKRPLTGKCPACKKYYIDAIQILYQKGNKSKRDKAYTKAMEKIY